MAQEQVIDDDLTLVREREEQIRELEVGLYSLKQFQYDMTDDDNS